VREERIMNIWKVYREAGHEPHVVSIEDAAENIGRHWQHPRTPEELTQYLADHGIIWTPFAVFAATRERLEQWAAGKEAS
jgi:hypothetical protein